MGRSQVDGHTRRVGRKTVYVKPHTRDLKEGPSSREIKAIPEVKGEVWLFGLQEHHAKKSGKHFDLRLGDPTGKAHSWYSTKGGPTLPNPGESKIVRQTFTHKNDYMPFQGKLESGHGQGNVFLKQYAYALIHSASPKKIVFSVTKGKSTEDYGLVHLGGVTWLLVNMTAPKEQQPKGRDRYREIGWKDSERDKLIAEDDVVVGAKLDGAHSLVLLRPGKRARAFSYREGKTGDLLEYTHKVADLYNTKYKGSGDTILRGEVMALKKDGSPLAAEKVGGLLNSTVLNSLGEQVASKLRTKIFLFDAVKVNGKDMSGLPYQDRVKVLRDISAKYPVFGVVPTAVTKEEKVALMKAIETEAHPLTREGVVIWTKKGPVKSKIRKDWDVYVRDIFEGEGKYKGKAAGGFSYSFSRKGPIAGKVGTGFTDDFRKDLWENRKKYKGLVARLTAERQHESGALAKPSFDGWHVEKNIG